MIQKSNSVLQFNSHTYMAHARNGSTPLFVFVTKKVLNSFGLGYRLTDSETDKESYLERVLDGAATLHTNRWAVSLCLLL